MTKRVPLIKNPVITDFHVTEHVEWSEIERVLGKRKYKKFCKWMNGQTCHKDGAYVCDVSNFLRKEKDRFFD